MKNKENLNIKKILEEQHIHVVTKVCPNDRYDVRKIGIGEGPTFTSTSVDQMKRWEKT